MSFILDALKSLEQKRHRESVPDLTTIHFSENYGQKKRSPWLYVLAAALLMNAAVLGVWLFSGDTEKEEVIVRSTAGETETARPVIKEPAPVKKTSLSRPAEDNKEAKKKPAVHAEKTRKEEKLNMQKSVKNITALRLDMSEKELDDLRTRISKEQLPADDPLPAYLHPAKEADNSSLSGKVLELGELPVSIREELPQIRISSHIYSNEPGSRIVNINGSIIREGESVIKGLKLEEITMTGIILDYQGYIFRIRAF